MSNYLFIESRDPFESRDTFVEDTAMLLKERGHQVTVFLVQNGVLASRQTVRDSALSRMSETGINLMADDFSLSERGIRQNELLPGVKPADIETLVGCLIADDTKAIWH